MKKMFALLFACTMLLSCLTFSVAAASDITPFRWEPCPNCANGQMYLRTSTGPWYTVGYQQCPTHPRYNDDVQNRVITNYETCSTCAYTITSSHTETRVVCAH